MKKPRRKPAQPEKAEQAQLVQLLKSLGAKVYVLGTHRRKGDFHGTMQTPGVQDVQAFVPRGACMLNTYELVFIEVKSSTGRLRPEQRELRTFCEQAGIAHVVGGYTAVVAWLLARGYAGRDQFPHYRLPAESTT